MNVVLFHIGIYDERQPDYIEKYPLFKKCYDSVLREFSNDNIIIFHNIEEVFKKYAALKSIIYSNYIKFWKNNTLTIQLDLVRYLLTFFIKDMVYIDSDIYVYDGFKKSLLFEKDKLFYFNGGTTSLFYSKGPSPSIGCFLNSFKKESYYNDWFEIQMCDFSKAKDIAYIEFDKYTHFAGLQFIKYFNKINTECYIEDLDTDLKKETLYICKNGVKGCMGDGMKVDYYVQDNELLKIFLSQLELLKKL